MRILRLVISPAARRGILRRRQCGQAAAAACLRVGETARHLRRGRHDARPAHGLHGQSGRIGPAAHRNYAEISDAIREFMRRGESSARCPACSFPLGRLARHSRQGT